LAILTKKRIKINSNDKNLKKTVGNAPDSLDEYIIFVLANTHRLPIPASLYQEK
jgi:hypothetical protein